MTTVLDQAGPALDERLRTIQERSRAAAVDLRARALAIDADPDAMEGHLDSPVFAILRASTTPTQWRDSATDTDAFSEYGGSCLENAVGSVELARGDAATALACPAPGLAGALVNVLGSPEQQERFYARLRDGRTWTFFAMTEPDHGSDAVALESRLDRDGSGGWLLTGRKRYIGNGARGGIGVVFARTGASALSIRAVLVDVARAGPGWSGRPLEMIGLRGAYISELSFEQVPVPADMLLGEHLPVTRRGLWGAMTTFNRMRVQVAASAVGTALAMAEYVAATRPGAAGVDVALARAEAARQMVYTAATRVDRDPNHNYLPSAAKLGAARLAIHTAHWAAGALGPNGLLDHPLVEKWIRDSSAYEFMEGTTNIQRLHVARGYQSGDADD